MADTEKLAKVGPGDYSDGTEVVFRAGKNGELIVQQLFGNYAELAQRGYVFVARSGAAAAIPVNTTLTNSPTLWNPADSGKLVIPLLLNLSCVNIGTYVEDGFTVSYLTSTGSTVATGLPLATFTNIAPVSTLLGAGKTATTKFANGTVTFTTQPAALMDLGMGQNVQGTAANGEPYNLSFDFRGAIIMRPGTSISIGAATAASSATYWASIVFAEVPAIDGV